MEVTSTIEINGEEREIADAYARGNINSLNNNLDTLAYSENSINGNIVNGTNLIGTAVREGSFALSDSVVIPSGSNTISTVYFTDGTKSTLNFSFSDGSVALPNPTTSDFTVSHVYFNSVHVGKIIKNIQLEIGTTSKGELYYVSSNNKLTKEIHKLNDSLKPQKNIFNGNWNIGYYWDSTDGQLKSNSHWNATDKYPCLGNGGVKINVGASTSIGLIFFDKNGGVVSSLSSDNVSEYGAKIPSNATMYAFNVNLTSISSATIMGDTFVTEVASEVASLKSDLIVLETTSTIDMTASRELDDITSSALTIPSGYKPIAMYGYNQDNNDNVSAMPLLIRSDGKVLFHAKNHSTSDQGIIHFVIRVTFKKMS